MGRAVVTQSLAHNFLCKDPHVLHTGSGQGPQVSGASLGPVTGWSPFLGPLQPMTTNLVVLKGRTAPSHVRSQESEVKAWQGWARLEPPGEGPSSLSQLLGPPGVRDLWTHHPNLCFRLLLCASVSNSP